jgi:DNA-3-methyladenine glycosylase
MAIVSAEFYARPAVEVARALLGTYLVSTIGGTRVSGRIVETEAYVGPHDEASHAAARIGRTPRNEPMFGKPGVAYVYRIYGVHWCLNAVTDEADFPAAVLIRAARPIEGVEAATLRRSGVPLQSLMRGPGNLCAALGITGSLNLHDFMLPPLQIVAGDRKPAASIAVGPRIGITRSSDLPLRFWLRGDPYVTSPRGRKLGS